jgi:hypothetical protein
MTSDKELGDKIMSIVYSEVDIDDRGTTGNARELLLALIHEEREAAYKEGHDAGGIACLTAYETA